MTTQRVAACEVLAQAARARVVHITLALSKHASAPRAPAVEQAGARSGSRRGRSHRLQQSFAA